MGRSLAFPALLIAIWNYETLVFLVCPVGANFNEFNSCI